MKMLAVDQGSYTIKAVELERTFRGVRVLRFIEEPVGLDHWFPKEQLSFRQIEEKIHQTNPDQIIANSTIALLEKYGLSDTKIITCLPPTLYSTRFLDWPTKERKKAASTILFNLEDEIPWETDLTLPDIAVLAPISGDRKNYSKLLVNFIPRDQLRKFLDSWDKHEPDFLSVQPLAWAALAAEHPQFQSQDQCTAIVDIGHYYTAVSVFVGKALRAYRCFVGGGFHITENISLTYQVSLYEAETHKVQNGFVLTSFNTDVDKEDVAFSDCIKFALDPVIADIRHTLLASKIQKIPDVSKIYVTGGTSRLANFLPYLEEQLRIPVAPFDVVNQLKDIHIPEDRNLDSALSIGLGMLGSQRDRAQFPNIRRKEFAKRDSFKGVDMSTVSTPLTLTLIWSICLSISFFSQKMIISKFLEPSATKYEDSLKGVFGKDFNKRLKARYMESPEDLRKDFEKKLREAAVKIKNFKVDLPKTTISSVLYEMSRLTPSQVKVDLLELKIDQSKLTAVAATTQSAEWQKSLSQSSLLKDISMAPQGPGHFVLTSKIAGSP